MDKLIEAIIVLLCAMIIGTYIIESKRIEGIIMGAVCEMRDDIEEYSQK